MEKEFVTNKQALLLKELGFNDLCFAVFINGKWQPRYKSKNSTFDPNKQKKLQKRIPDIFCTAPTYSQAFRFFRDNYGLSGVVNEAFSGDDRCGYICVKSPIGLKYIKSIQVTSFYENYKEAESACLDKLIELCKEKNNIKNAE